MRRRDEAHGEEGGGGEQKERWRDRRRCIGHAREGRERRSGVREVEERREEAGGSRRHARQKRGMRMEREGIGRQRKGLR